jgi:hypothetical protein
MAEETSNPKIIEREVLKETGTVKLELPISYYVRINQFLFEFFPFKDDKHLGEIITKIAEGKDETDVEAYHFRTLLSLQLLIEDAAKQQGQTEIVKIDAEKGERIP